MALRMNWRILSELVRGSPVLGDLTEQAALHRVVLGGAGGIVGNGDGESELIPEALLDRLFLYRVARRQGSGSASPAHAE